MGGQKDGPAAAPAGQSDAVDGVQRYGFKGMPWSQVLAFTVTNLAQGVMLTMPFTVAVYMVRGWLAGSAAAADEGSVGRLTGLLAALYSFAQFTTSYAWGIFSSRFGRKPVMVLGSCASTATLLWFGLSGGFPSAAAARVVAGLLNGIIVSWKCSIGESCEPLEQGRILSYMSLSWGIGCILGPSIGGLASAPCSTWAHLPGCAPGGLLLNRPYFLACAISAGVNAVALVLNLCVLRETLPRLVVAKQQQQQQHGSGTGVTTWKAITWLRQGLGCSFSHSYARFGSVVDTNANSSSSIDGGSGCTMCGPGCTGCPVCWQLWRAESGLVQGCQQQQQQQLLRPLQAEGSAFGLELAAVKVKQQQQQEEEDGKAQASQSSDTAAAVVQSAQAPSNAAGISRVMRLQPNDSASERTLQHHKPGSCKVEAATSLGPEQQQQQQQHNFSAPGSASDCTILVSEQQSALQQDIHRSDQQEDLQSACDAPLLGKQQRSSSSSRSADNSSKDTSAGSALLPWYRDRQVVLVLLAYGTVCLLFCAIDELTPIFASAPLKQGGLSLSEVQLAGPLSFSGACLILVSLFAFPAAQRAWGTLSVTRRGLMLAVVVAFAIPCTSFAVQQTGSSSNSSSSSAGGRPGGNVRSIGWAAWLVLYIAMLLKSLAGCFAFTGTMIVVNTSVDPQQLGAVNGVGQSLASLARGVGPAVGGLLWGLTVHLQGHVHGAQLLPFACVAGTAVVALLLYAFVKPNEPVEAEVPSKGTSCCQE